jgi:hypothetical protein
MLNLIMQWEYDVMFCSFGEFGVSGWVESTVENGERTGRGI